MECLPKIITVKSILSGKYTPGTKPSDWSLRNPGYDTVVDGEGREIKLESDGDQCTPKVGWKILLTKEGKHHNTFKWTLYGI